MSKLVAPATSRNRAFILEVLRRVLPNRGDVLEIASGSGEHAVHFAAALPDLVWHPTDPDAAAVSSVGAYRAEAGLPNLEAPRRLDVHDDDWHVPRADAVVCINMIHIAPWSATRALFRGAGRLLRAGELVYLYGPFRFGGQLTAPSNEAFDASLRERDPLWGVRDLDDVSAVAAGEGFARDEVTPMPANNHSIVFRKA